MDRQTLAMEKLRNMVLERDERIRSLEEEKELFVKSLVGAGEECLRTLKELVADSAKEED